MSLRRALVPLVLSLVFAFPVSGDSPADWRVILDRVEKAYSLVSDYRAEVEVRNYGEGGFFETERFLYTFRKPKSIRIDFITPHPGMVLTYPDKDGKVAVRPSGVARFLTLSLAPDNALVRTPSGQTMDKTDMGSLIEHMGRAATDERRGPVEAWGREGSAGIRVLAVNHFRKDELILYEFAIDTVLWLPREVRELAPEGKVRRIITFRNLEINRGVPENLFRLHGEKEDGKKEKDGK